MFTGLIECSAKITTVTPGDKSVSITLEPRMTPFALKLGDSVAVDGVCLTAERISGRLVTFRAVAETVERTTLSTIRPGQIVNIERSLAVGGRVDGHFVLGHVDGVGKMSADRKVGDSLVRTISIPAGLSVFIAEKGSVALDGISLTVCSADERSFAVSLIPYSLEHTTMSAKQVGSAVNIECDILARYLYRFATSNKKTRESVGGESSSGLYTQLERLGF